MSKFLKVLLVLTFTFVFVWSSSKPNEEDPNVLYELEEKSNSQQKISLESSTFKEKKDFFETEDHDNLWTDDAISDDDSLDAAQSPIIDANIQTTNKTKRSSSLLLVSTLDGTLSALDATDNGNVVWKVETGPASLLSSSISKVELNSHGKMVRLIPSLEGRLYKFDGENIEQIPISADSLLHSSYHAADDLLISGGKEVRTYGVDAQTGHLQYACSADGCHAEPAEASSSEELLVIRRHSQIIRAVEPRTGTERWNFSVGRHEASLLHTHADSFADCKADNFQSPEKQMDCIINSPSATDRITGTESGVEPLNSASMEFKVMVPDGVVCAVQADPTRRVLWQYKFESPVVHVWHLKDGSLTSLDLFRLAFNQAIESQPDSRNDPAPSPSLYVGIHNEQLYVQESKKTTDLSLPGSSQQVISNDVDSRPARLIRLPWNPLPATSMIMIKGKSGDSASLVASTKSEIIEAFDHDNDSKDTALIVRHQTDFPYDRGFYLFEDTKTQICSNDKTSQDQISDSLDEMEEELWEGGRDTPVHIVIVSLWFWWREVVFISLLTAIVFHMVITRQVVNLLQQRWAIELHRHISAVVPPLARLTKPPNQLEQALPLNIHPNNGGLEVLPDQSMESVVVQQTVNSIHRPAASSYVSRYLTDFEPIQCLGRGGFGLVFEVRNRLDDCHYAVKRIQLPNSEEAREKVMREVKALAKLDNPHIVRYFHAWVECPPPGWQESQDAAWIDSESLTGPTPFNTGDESYVSKMNPSETNFTSSDEESTANRLEFPKTSNSIDSLIGLQKSYSSDSSFDVVFEYSSQPLSSSDSKPANQTENSNQSCSKTNISARGNSLAIFRKPSTAEGKRRRRDVHKVPTCRISDTKMFLFIQMQLCRKESLREWLRAHVSHRDTLQVLYMFNEIVRAVEYVHLQGLIHRDLKPSNIFFAPDGAIKIGDFGLVTAMAEEAYFHTPTSSVRDASINNVMSPFQRTHTDQVGTQMYMSPEQIEGKPYSHKVDIYSLGLILVELLWPLGTQMEQVTVISQLRKLRFPQGFNDKYPEETILLNKMLSRNPDERPTTFGIRASSPLKNFQDPTIDIPEHLQFHLQRQRSATRTSSTSSS